MQNCSDPNPTQDIIEKGFNIYKEQLTKSRFKFEKLQAELKSCFSKNQR